MTGGLKQVIWPEGKRFAFTIFDDPDSQTLEDGREVYAFVADQGFRTTKAVWPLMARREPSDHGATCGTPGYVRWVQSLQEKGFEIGYHNATSHTSTREETKEGLLEFDRLFGHSPNAMANHYFCDEKLYWCERRTSSWRRSLYKVLTRYRNSDSFGHVEGHPLFWGDLCLHYVRYVRNFVFREINTLRVCPFLPYHDPDRPFVNFWYAAAEGANVDFFNRTLEEGSQDRLEEEGGLCIMYAHFGHRFHSDGRLNTRFVKLMERLSRKNGWFAPVSTILDYLRAHRGDHMITPAERARLETLWLWNKIFYGTA